MEKKSGRHDYLETTPPSPPTKRNISDEPVSSVTTTLCGGVPTRSSTAGSEHSGSSHAGAMSNLSSAASDGDPPTRGEKHSVPCRERPTRPRSPSWTVARCWSTGEPRIRSETYHMPHRRILGPAKPGDDRAQASLMAWSTKGLVD